MGFQQTDLDALEAAIAQGILRVRYLDKEVIYRSLAEMLQIRDMMKKTISSGSTYSGKKFASYSSGIRK